MKSAAENIVGLIPSFNELKVIVSELATKEKIYVSPFAGSSKSLFITTLIEKEIVLLCPTVQSVNETKVELSILGLDRKSVV